MPRPALLLRRLERERLQRGTEAAHARHRLLDDLASARFARATDLARFHDCLLFLRAYPDDAGVADRVDRLLTRFADRADLARHRSELVNSGVAGTALCDRFYWFPARWLERRWGALLTIDWSEFENHERLYHALHLLAHFAETPGLDEDPRDARGWLRTLKGPDETDAAFLIRRFQALRLDPFAREAIYNDLDPPLRLAPDPTTPARTREVLRDRPIAFRDRAFRRRIRSARAEALRPPDGYRVPDRAEARSLLELARGAMVARQRDLDAFAHASPDDVRIAGCGKGLEIVAIGVIPERRLLLECVYGYLALQNGVLIGYGTASALFGSVEIAYNLFPAFRGGEAGHVFGRILGTFRALLSGDTFTLDPYQVGLENDEALRSGAWWFYRKMGFRPRDREAIRLMKEEEAKMRRDPRHRSTRRTLARLAEERLFLTVAGRRSDVLGLFPLDRVGLAVTSYLSRRFGADRDRGDRVCAEEAARRLGTTALVGRFSAGERLAWNRWAPLVAIIPGLDDWPRADRLALARTIQAKGSRCESDYLARFDRHHRLRRALSQLVEKEPDA